MRHTFQMAAVTVPNTLESLYCLFYITEIERRAFSTVRGVKFTPLRQKMAHRHDFQINKLSLLTLSFSPELATHCPMAQTCRYRDCGH